MPDSCERSGWRTAVAAALVLLPILSVVAKLLHGPQWILAPTSLESLPRHAHKHVEYLMFVPFSTSVVAFFRLTLGIRVLSIFRPALLAIAFERTGIPLGMLFLALSLAVVVAAEPGLRGRDYYERAPVIVVLVVTLMVMSLVGFERSREVWMLRLAYFPVIALCLTCESFASALVRSGLAEAVWKAAATAAIGIIVMGASRVPGLMTLFVRCPELLVAQAGGVLLIGERFNWRLLEGFNPISSLAQRRRPIELRLGAQIKLVETNE